MMWGPLPYFFGAAAGYLGTAAATKATEPKVVDIREGDPPFRILRVFRVWPPFRRHYKGQVRRVDTWIDVPEAEGDLATVRAAIERMSNGRSN